MMDAMQLSTLQAISILVGLVAMPQAILWAGLKRGRLELRFRSPTGALLFLQGCGVALLLIDVIARFVRSSS